MKVQIIECNTRNEYAEELAKYLNEGYKIHTSTIIPRTTGIRNYSLTDQNILYYALMIKE